MSAPEFGGVRGVARDDEDERLHQRPSRFARVRVQLHLHVLVQADAVFELDALDLVGRDAGGVEVLPRDDRRLLHEAVVHRLRQRVAVDDVLEVDRAPRRLSERRRRQLQPQHRLQLVDGAHAGAGAIAVRLVHQQHEVVETGQVVEVALADVLGQPLDPRRPAAAHLAVDLRDVEDVDPAGRELVQQRRVVVVARDHLRRLGGELGDALEARTSACSGVKSAISFE